MAAEDGGAKDQRLADMFRQHGAAFVRRRVVQFMDELRAK